MLRINPISITTPQHIPNIIPTGTPQLGRKLRPRRIPRARPTVIILSKKHMIRVGRRGSPDTPPRGVDDVGEGRVHEDHAGVVAPGAAEVDFACEGG